MLAIGISGVEMAVDCGTQNSTGRAHKVIRLRNPFGRIRSKSAKHPNAERRGAGMTRKEHLTVFWRALRAWLPVTVLACIFPLLAMPISAQSVFDTGTIAGSVVDPSGALVPHAKVTITNTQTSTQRLLETDNKGNFVASAMPLGTYVVAVTAPGFG